MYTCLKINEQYNICDFIYMDLRNALKAWIEDPATSVAKSASLPDTSEIRDV